jgi:hypothetical protein
MWHPRQYEREHDRTLPEAQRRIHVSDEVLATIMPDPDLLAIFVGEFLRHHTVLPLRVEKPFAWEEKDGHYGTYVYAIGDTAKVEDADSVRRFLWAFFRLERPQRLIRERFLRGRTVAIVAAIDRLYPR